jgi:hypothetical protein
MWFGIIFVGIIIAAGTLLKITASRDYPSNSQRVYSAIEHGYDGLLAQR